MKCPSSVILLLFAFLSHCIVCCFGVRMQSKRRTTDDEAISNTHLLYQRAYSARCPVVRLDNGKVRLRARGRIIRFSCAEDYTLVGNKYSTCVRGQWDTPTPVCVSALCSFPPTPDHALVASKLDGAVLMYFCEPGYNLTGSAEIYCDGRQWNTSVPYCRDTTASAPTKCDFETPDLCWWEQDPTHDFDWKRHNFETPSLHIGTGPTHDHTLGVGNDGYYLYIEASGRLVNDTARIVSPLYNSSLTESGCFSFWYHMYGATIGALNIYFKQETDATSRLMFSKTGNQGNEWFHGVFDLPRTNISFQIVIEGVRGSSYVSDIAIDDVALLRGDECAVKNESTDATARNDDQIELINAQQSCRNRCVNVMTEALSTLSTPSYGPPDCQCTLDCADRFFCCPDYAEYCILGVKDVEPDTTITTPYSLPNVTKSPDKNDAASGNKTTYAPLKYTTLPGFSINPKDDIDPGTTSSTTTRKPTTFVTTQIWRTTTRRRPTTISVKGTQASEQARETAFVPNAMTIPTTKYMELQDRTEKYLEKKLETVKHSGRFEVLAIGVGIGVTFAFAFALALAIFVIRRRRSYKRGTGGSGLSEDSDVRFLTSDEILDFNLARPADNDEL